MYKPHKFKPAGGTFDIVAEVLQLVLAIRPDAAFVQSLYQQYQERGSLSKKQLQGLYQKAVQTRAIPPARLATLEALILKMPDKFKTAPPPPKPVYTKDEKAGNLIAEVLAKMPTHKRALALQNKYNNNEQLTATEIAELEKFCRLLSAKQAADKTGGRD